MHIEKYVKTVWANMHNCWNAFQIQSVDVKTGTSISNNYVCLRLILWLLKYHYYIIQCTIFSCAACSNFIQLLSRMHLIHIRIMRVPARRYHILSLWKHRLIVLLILWKFHICSCRRDARLFRCDEMEWEIGAAMTFIEYIDNWLETTLCLRCDWLMLNVVADFRWQLNIRHTSICTKLKFEVPTLTFLIRYFTFGTKFCSQQATLYSL